MLSVEVARRVEKWLTRLYGSLAYNVRYPDPSFASLGEEHFGPVKKPQRVYASQGRVMRQKIGESIRL